jgi:hypothetical protein
MASRFCFYLCRNDGKIPGDSRFPRPGRLSEKEFLGADDADFTDFFDVPGYLLKNPE